METKDMIHAYAGSVPLMTICVHKGEKYLKIKEEYALNEKGDEVLFESHWGVFVDEMLKPFVQERPL